MKRVEKQEMMAVKGGVNIALITITVSVVVFLSGIITGIVNPIKCNE